MKENRFLEGATKQDVCHCYVSLSYGLLWQEQFYCLLNNFCFSSSLETKNFNKSGLIFEWGVTGEVLASFISSLVQNLYNREKD